MARILRNPNALANQPDVVAIRGVLVDMWSIVSPFSAPQSGDYTTTGEVAHERVIMTNTSSATVTLHANPSELTPLKSRFLDQLAGI